MSFSGLILTNAGRNELIKAEMGTPFRITDIVFGDGSYNGSYTAIKSLSHKVMEMPVTKIERKGDEVWVECDFVSTDVPEAFYMREIGIIANGQLCYYDNAREDAEYIDPESENLIKQKRMRFVLLISGEVEIHAEIVSSLYALETDLRECVATLDAEITALEEPTFTQADARENIVSGENLSTILGKIMKFFADLKSVAFSGSYNDLSNKPSIPAAVAVKGNAEATYRTGNVNLTPVNIGLGNVANERQYSASNPQPSVAGSSGSCTGNAATATKATQDGNGRNIAATYLPKSDIGINYGASLTVTKSIPNDVETEILSVTIGVAGVYLIHGQANFASNKTGLRRIELKNTNANGSFGGSQVGASSSGKTDVQVVGVSASTFAVGEKVRLYAHQNCGAALNVTSAYMSAIRLR